MFEKNQDLGPENNNTPLGDSSRELELDVGDDSSREPGLDVWDDFSRESYDPEVGFVETIKPDPSQSAKIGHFVLGMIDNTVAQSAEVEVEPGGSSLIRPEVEPGGSSLNRPEIESKSFNKGVRFLFVGPARSGKSIFMHAVSQCLDPNVAFSFQANPDGESRPVQENYTLPAAKRMREEAKGKYTPEFIERVHDVLRDWEGPALLVGFGGDISIEERRAQKRRMLEDSPKETYAIIVSGSDDKRAKRGGRLKEDKEPQSAMIEMQKWEKFLEEQGIKTIAKVYSSYESKRDLVVNNGESGTFKGSVHHLERGESADDRETVQRVAGLISAITEKEAHLPEDIGRNGFTVSVEDLVKSLPHEEKEIKTIGKNGETHVSTKNWMIPSSIPEIYGRMKAYEDMPVRFFGPISGWGAMALASALRELGNENVSFMSPDGMAKTEVLPMEAEGQYDEKWWKEPEALGELNGKPVIMVENIANASSHSMSIDQLKDLTVPAVPENAVVIVSTAGANWLKASIAMGYVGKVDAIVARAPFGKSPVVWTREESREMLGDTIRDEYSDGIILEESE